MAQKWYPFTKLLKVYFLHASIIIKLLESSAYLIASEIQSSYITSVTNLKWFTLEFQMASQKPFSYLLCPYTTLMKLQDK